jgi:hypothetical protein
MNDEYYFYVEDNTIFILKDDNRENNYWGDGVHFKGVPIKHEQFDELFVSLREEKINQILCQK